MGNFSIAIQVLPKSSSNEETIKGVDKVIDYISSFNVNYVVTPFETVIEGDYESLMNILKGVNDLLVNSDLESYLAYVKINYNKNGVMTIDEKTSKFKH